MVQEFLEKMYLPTCTLLKPFLVCLAYLYYINEIVLSCGYSHMV